MLFTFKYFNYLLSDVKSGDIIVSINLFISHFFLVPVVVNKTNRREEKINIKP